MANFNNDGTNYGNNGIKNVFPFNVSRDIIVMRDESFALRPLMGPMQTMPIYHHQVAKGQNVVSTPKMAQLDYTKYATDFNMVRPQLQRVNIDNCDTRITLFSSGVEIDKYPLMEVATPVMGSLDENIKNGLAISSATRLTYKFFDNMTKSLYNITANGSMPLSHRGIYGTNNYTYVNNAILPARLNALAANLDASTQPTLASLMRASTAVNNPNKDGRIISPVVRSVQGYPSREYWIVASPTWWEQLCTDQAFERQFLARGIELKNQPSLIYNPFFKGTVAGFNILIVPELENYRFAADGTYASTGIYSWSFILGACAIDFPYAGDPETLVVYDEIEKWKAIVMHEMLGMGAFVYPSALAAANAVTKKYEQGFIHMFNRVA